MLTLIDLSTSNRSINKPLNIEKIYKGQFSSYDPVLGFSPPAMRDVTDILRVNSEVLYDVTYSFDVFGRRFIKF